MSKTGCLLPVCGSTPGTKESCRPGLLTARRPRGYFSKGLLGAVAHAEADVGEPSVEDGR
jgi:hypothetical protein